MMDFLLDDTKKRPGKNPEPLFLRLLPLAQVVVHLLVLLVVLGLRLPHPVIAALQGHQLVVAADFPDAAGPSAERLKRGAGAKSDDLLPKPLLAKKKKKTDPPPSEGGKSAFAAINKILLKSGVRSARTVLPRQWEPRPPAPGSSSRPRRACQTRSWRRR